MKLKSIPKPGDRVIIKRKDIKALERRRRPVTGTVVSRDGMYLFVRPSWCSWETQLYSNEVEKI